MRQRIFIAINLPEEIKEQLISYQDKWLELPCRWTKKENLHITLEFLGYLADEEIAELCQKTKETASVKKVFDLHLNKVCYGPIGKKSPLRSMSPSDSFLPSSSSSIKSRTPRMVWVMGDKIKGFNVIPHITLGRIKTWQFKQINPDERPEINEDINLRFKVESIEIMESRLKRGGPEYTVLESIPLSK